MVLQRWRAEALTERWVGRGQAPGCLPGEVVCVREEEKGGLAGVGGHPGATHSHLGSRETEAPVVFCRGSAMPSP